MPTMTSTRGGRRPAGLLVAGLVTGLVAGLVVGAGGATAAGLTRNTVRRIAVKVVKKQAGSLSVGHATSADTATTSGTAGNANALGGKPPSAYSDDTVRYSLV